MKNIDAKGISRVTSLFLYKLRPNKKKTSSIMITQFHILSRMTCKDPQSDGWVKLELSKQLPGLSSNKKHYF